MNLLPLALLVVGGFAIYSMTGDSKESPSPQPKNPEDPIIKSLCGNLKHIEAEYCEKMTYQLKKDWQVMSDAEKEDYLKTALQTCNAVALSYGNPENSAKMMADCSLRLQQLQSWLEQ